MSNYTPSYELLEARLQAVTGILQAVAGVIASARIMGGVSMRGTRDVLIGKLPYDELERAFKALIAASADEDAAQHERALAATWDVAKMGGDFVDGANGLEFVPYVQQETNSK